MVPSVLIIGPIPFLWFYYISAARGQQECKFLHTWGALQVMLFLTSKFLFFQTHCRVLPEWVEESWSARNWVNLEGWVILPVKLYWTINISTKLTRIATSFGWLEHNFCRSLLHFTCLLATISPTPVRESRFSVVVLSGGRFFYLPNRSWVTPSPFLSPWLPWVLVPKARDCLEC